MESENLMSAVVGRKRVGILGGGQLGLMLAQAGSQMNIYTAVLDPNAEAPAKRAANKLIVGDFRDESKIRELSAEVDLITFEIEHVNVDALERVRASAQPTAQTIRVIQDKFEQKSFLRSHGIAVPDFYDLKEKKVVDISHLVDEHQIGYPFMLKSKTLAYDGRGNAVVRSPADIEAAVKKLGNSTGSLYIEKWVPFTKELAVMVAKGLRGDVKAYPVVETIQKDSICHVVLAPAQTASNNLAQQLAIEAVSKFEGAGIYGVELFLLPDGSVLLNEIAPRPHNSGHYTIEACHTSQYEQHLRCVLGFSLGSTSMKVGASIMLNVLGGETLEETFKVCDKALRTPTCSLHWYGKSECRRGRKMGHITICADDMGSAYQTLNSLLIEGGSDNLPSSLSIPPPVVGVIMGSDSDLGTMRACAQTLREFNVPFELTIVSAHRTPDRLMNYCKTAHLRGLKVIIAAAGGAAHLPGMAAAITPLPVVGVPVALKNLDGVDSLHSIVQMPRGVPVACVAINNSTNAALLAIRMLGMHSERLLQKMLSYQQRMKDQVLEKVERLENVGWESYGQ